MKFTAHEDVEAPVAEVWAVVVDYDLYETAALRRGADVQRVDRGGQPAWQATFAFRGKPRQATIGIDRAEEPVQLVVSATGKAVEGVVAVDLVELGPRRTRISVTSELRPRTLAARLFLQSLRLARGRVVKRYQHAVGQLANMVEARTRDRRAGS